MPSEKKMILCRRCKPLYEDADPKLKLRGCDEKDCGRVHCHHMGVRGADGKDKCGPCNLRSCKKAAKKKPDEKKGEAAGA